VTVRTPTLPASETTAAHGGDTKHEHQPAVSRPLVWFVLAVWAVLLGVSVALALNAVLFGRIPLAALVPRGLAGVAFAPIAIATACWWLIYFGMLSRAGTPPRTASIIFPALPLLFGTTLPMLGIYVSDTINHYFYYSFVHLNQPKGLAILLVLMTATVLLQSACLENHAGASLWLSLKRAAARVGAPLTFVLLTAMGVLQASVYQTNFGVDFLRYWSIADAITQRVPYPAFASTSQYVAGGMTAKLIDLPFYPTLMAASFGLFGHTTAAPYIAAAATNAALPPLLFLLFRELIRNRAAAISLTSLVVLFPLLRLHTLNWWGTDSTFFAALTCSAWLFVRIANGDTRYRTWLPFGLLAAATVLTRPEGLAYSFCYIAVAMFLAGRTRQKLGAAILFLAPLAAFSLVMMTSFGIPWPQNWAGAVRPENILLNVPVLISDGFFNSAVRLSPVQLAVGWGVLLLLAAVGSTPFIHRPWFLAAVTAPAWVNLLTVYMVDPRVSGARLWFDFFRHMSYVIPFMILAAGKALDTASHLPKSTLWRGVALAALNIFLFAAVLWNYSYLSKPSWSFGPDASNLIDTGRVNLIDIVTNPIRLPLLDFDSTSGNSTARFPADLISNFPDSLNGVYEQFDAVKQMSGTSYEIGSLFVYLAALALAFLPVSRSPQSGDQHT
jgi:hypothetical protein